MSDRELQELPHDQSEGVRAMSREELAKRQAEAVQWARNDGMMHDSYRGIQTTRPTRLPYGCDYQGRYPEAAEPCTDLGRDDDETTAADVGFIVMLLVVAAMLTVITVVLGMVFAG
jgi:hypothetical protein